MAHEVGHYVDVATYWCRIEKSDGHTTFVRLDPEASGERFDKAVEFFLGKFDSREAFPVEMWVGRPIRITALRWNKKQQLLRLKLERVEGERAA